MRRQTLIHFFCAIVCAALFQTAPAAKAQSDRQIITGTLFVIGGRTGASRSRSFRLIANSYTAPNQVRELNDALRHGGQNELLRELSDMNAGRIEIGSGVGLRANAIIADPWDNGGTKLTVFYERDIRFFELRYGTRSRDYTIGYAEIFLDRNGRGEGTLIGAARVRLREGNTWEVEDFGTFPGRLMGLRSSGRVQPQ
jgi:hypothetical protein